MKILFFLNPRGLMDRDLVYTFRKRGIEVLEEELVFALTPEGHTVEMFSSTRLKEILDGFRPDMVFSFNGDGVDDKGDISGDFARRGIPYVTWFVDRPRVADIGQKYVKDASCIFVFDRVYVDTLKGCGFDRVFYLPLAANPDRFRPMDGVGREGSVCFVGDTDYGKIQYLARNIDSMVQGAHEKLYGAVEAAIREQYVQAGRDTWVIIEETFHGQGIETGGFPQLFRDILEGFVEREASLRLRLDTVKAVRERHPVTVYGDTLWERVVGSGYKGMVNYFGDDVVEVYNRYAVHVNVSKFQLRWAINQRPFDISACGGFVLSDERQSLRELFEEDELITYRNLDELVELAGYYLENEAARRSLAAKARARVLKEHTYANRVARILQVVLG
jgi:spore maturation protein CgeB